MSVTIKEIGLLLAYLNPHICAPIMLAAVSHLPPKRQGWILIREMAAALIAMIVFGLVGSPVLQAMGIDISSIQISGGLILMYTGFQLMYSSDAVDIDKPKDAALDEPLIVPLAIPLLCGPAVMSVLVSFASTKTSMEVLQVIFGAWIPSFFIVMGIALFGRYLPKSFFLVSGKVGGLIITYLAVQMAVSGVLSVVRSI